MSISRPGVRHTNTTPCRSTHGSSIRPRSFLSNSPNVDSPYTPLSSPPSMLNDQAWYGQVSARACPRPSHSSAPRWRHTLSMACTSPLASRVMTTGYADRLDRLVRVLVRQLGRERERQRDALEDEVDLGLEHLGVEVVVDGLLHRGVGLSVVLSRRCTVRRRIMAMACSRASPSRTSLRSHCGTSSSSWRFCSSAISSVMDALRSSCVDDLRGGYDVAVAARWGLWSRSALAERKGAGRQPIGSRSVPRSRGWVSSLMQSRTNRPSGQTCTREIDA